jgi:uncharacterized membrane protein YczE
MGLNFNDKVLITNPTSYFLGRGILIVGLIVMGIGGTTYFTGDFLMPAMAWLICGLAPTFIGWTIMRSGLRKN